MQARKDRLRAAICLASIATAIALMLAACSAPSSDAVPSAGAASAQAGTSTPQASKHANHPRVGYSATRVEQLHAAAQCLREHGVPNYQDPVLTADGYVFTDSRSVQDAEDKLSTAERTAKTREFEQACGHLFATAGLQPDDESPAPPALVQAGVRAAVCLRAHGLPHYRDPNSESTFTPGHGFGVTADELPNHGAQGKQDPTVRNALEACRSQLDAETTASLLSNLAHD